MEDYKLLEMMNRISINKYAEMKETAANLNAGLQQLNEKCNTTGIYDQIAYGLVMPISSSVLISLLK